MSDAFHSPRLTLTRAHHHIRDFKTMVTDFINSDPWADIVDKDSNPGQEIYKIKMTRQIPKDLPCVLFDATNNLRAVLDQAGHISAVVGKMPRLKAVKFPFAPTEADWRNNIAGGCKDLPAEIRTLFESFKSYEAGNPTLWAVNEIANAKKHFGLIPFGVGNAIARSQGEIIGSGFFNHISKGRGDAWDSAKKRVDNFFRPDRNETQDERPLHV
jgi:hypothetical protein